MLFKNNNKKLPQVGALAIFNKENREECVTPTAEFMNQLIGGIFIGIFKYHQFEIFAQDVLHNFLI
jgi:hypothetical protein